MQVQPILLSRLPRNRMVESGSIVPKLARFFMFDRKLWHFSLAIARSDCAFPTPFKRLTGRTRSSSRNLALG